MKGGKCEETKTRENLRPLWLKGEPREAWQQPLNCF